MTPANPSRSDGKGAAFTLVEVAISLGILAFCLISILGLVPVGLSSFRESIDASHLTRMLQSVRARLGDMPFSKLPAETTFEFDENGAYIPDTGSSVVRYEIKASITPSTSLPGGTLGSVAQIKLSVTNRVTGSSTKDHLHLSDNGF